MTDSAEIKQNLQVAYYTVYNSQSLVSVTCGDGGGVDPSVMFSAVVGVVGAVILGCLLMLASNCAMSQNTPERLVLNTGPSVGDNMLLLLWVMPLGLWIAGMSLPVEGPEAEATGMGNGSVAWGLRFAAAGSTLIFLVTLGHSTVSALLFAAGLAPGALMPRSNARRSTSTPPRASWSRRGDAASAARVPRGSTTSPS